MMPLIVFRRSGGDQINTAMQQLDQVIQQNSSVSEEMASTSEELAAQAEQLQAAIEFFNIGNGDRTAARKVAKKIGFPEKHRYFIHPDTEFFVEFPAGPLTVGDERVHEVTIRDTVAGRLRLLSPTDCIKDRLAAFFY